MTTVLCRLPNHVGDCCMCMPALRLLQASGFTPALVGKRWAGDLVAGMGWRFDPIAQLLRIGASFPFCACEGSWFINGSSRLSFK